MPLFAPGAGRLTKRFPEAPRKPCRVGEARPERNFRHRQVGRFQQLQGMGQAARANKVRSRLSAQRGEFAVQVGPAHGEVAAQAADVL